MNADRHAGPADRDLAAEEAVELTVVARQAGVKIVHVRRYLEFGLFEPHPAAASRNPTLRPEQRRAGGASGAATPRPRAQLRRRRARMRAARPDQRARGSAVRDAEVAGRRGYAMAMSEDVRIERGWIYIDGTRQDDGTIKLGTGGEMRFSPFEAISQRNNAQITWGNILMASVQRLAFWRR